jgi:hypothetical protein
MPEKGHREPGRGGGRRGQRGQGQPVHRGRDRSVPGQAGPVGAAAPGGGGAGHAPDPGQDGADRSGQPRLRRREPDRAAQQVHTEVGGEVDGRLEVGVDRNRSGDRRGGPPGCGDGDRRRRDGPVRTGTEPVDRQRRGAPGEVRAVGAGTPGPDPPAEAAPAGPQRRTGGGRRAPLDTEDTDGEPHGQSAGEVGEVRLDRQRGAGTEQARATGGFGGGHVGPRGLRRLDHHVLPSREVVAAAGEGTAGKEKSRDDGARRGVSGTLRSGRVTEPLRRPLRQVDDPPPGPVTCRQPAGKAQLSALISSR